MACEYGKECYEFMCGSSVDGICTNSELIKNKTTYNPGDKCVIESKTSSNNGKVATVIEYTNGKYKDIIKVQIGNTIFNIRETSLRPATKYDIIRNLDDREIDNLLANFKLKNEIQYLQHSGMGKKKCLEHLEKIVTNIQERLKAYEV